MADANPKDLKSGLMIHTVEPATHRMARWKKEIAEMSEAELVLASALIKVRTAELRALASKD